MDSYLRLVSDLDWDQRIVSDATYDMCVNIYTFRSEVYLCRDSSIGNRGELFWVKNFNNINEHAELIVYRTMLLVELR